MYLCIEDEVDCRRFQKLGFPFVLIAIVWGCDMQIHGGTAGCSPGNALSLVVNSSNRASGDGIASAIIVENASNAYGWSTTVARAQDNSIFNASVYLILSPLRMSSSKSVVCGFVHKMEALSDAVDWFNVRLI